MVSDIKQKKHKGIDLNELNEAIEASSIVGDDKPSKKQNSIKKTLSKDSRPTKPKGNSPSKSEQLKQKEDKPDQSIANASEASAKKEESVISEKPDFLRRRKPEDFEFKKTELSSPGSIQEAPKLRRLTGRYGTKVGVGVHKLSEVEGNIVVPSEPPKPKAGDGPGPVNSRQKSTSHSIDSPGSSSDDTATKEAPKLVPDSAVHEVKVPPKPPRISGDSDKDKAAVNKKKSNKESDIKDTDDPTVQRHPKEEVHAVKVKTKKSRKISLEKRRKTAPISEIARPTIPKGKAVAPLTSRQKSKHQEQDDNFEPVVVDEEETPEVEAARAEVASQTEGIEEAQNEVAEELSEISDELEIVEPVEATTVHESATQQPEQESAVYRESTVQKEESQVAPHDDQRLVQVEHDNQQVNPIYDIEDYHMPLQPSRYHRKQEFIIWFFAMIGILSIIVFGLIIVMTLLV